MKKQSILVVDDEEDILELVAYNLSKAGYTPHCVTTGQEALTMARNLNPDLIILDLMLPGIDGIRVCTLLKDDPITQPIPIVMLTAKGTESDIVRGLDSGADDYIVKPFSPRVLLARISAVLRRSDDQDPGENTPIEIHHIVIHPGFHEVQVAGNIIDLTYSEFRILQFLAQRPGWVRTRGQIINAIRGANHLITDRAVDVQVLKIRRKLGPLGQFIETVRGVGYRMKKEE